MGLINGLEIGKRALLATQLAMTTIGHNMANVNTPGYSRQRVNITSTHPLESIWGNVGSGVKVTTIENIRDLFLSGQYRNENANLGKWNSSEKSISQIEGFFNEPQENSLGNTLDEFWKAWSSVAGTADDIQARGNLLQQTNVLINGFHQLDRQFKDLRQSVDNDVRNKIMEINHIGSQIAGLNKQIAYQELGSGKANDLRDQRDYLIDELSQYADLKIMEKSNGSTTVMIGAMAFVDGDSTLKIGYDIEDKGDYTSTKIIWEATNLEVKFSSGEMSALINTRDTMIPNYMNKLDNLAKGIVERVNAIHRNGYTLDGQTGLNFFDPDHATAGGIQLALEMDDDANNVAAASGPDKPADGSNAEALAVMLNSSRVMSKDTLTLREYYGAIIGNLGTESRAASNYTENYGLLVQQIENQRQSVQGVSLDEEMTNLIRYQSAYKAAARVITVMDSALDTLINRTGIVGR